MALVRKLNSMTGILIKGEDTDRQEGHVIR